ncbi:MAG TPA: ROK family transcriptional regulator [Candidatus Limnocylindria bacterium]|nr:ROK family transcriptional regulator [Candidatus Limnocylindria bacterium]
MQRPFTKLESETTLPERATHQQTRAFNQQLVLRAIYDHGRISRAEVARQTGLTRTSVSQLVGELLNVGLVSEVGRGPSSGGKAPIMVSVATDSRHVLGLDLGEESFRGALVDLRGEILHSVSLPLDGRDGQAAVDLVLELVDRLQAQTQRPLLGIGIGAPGLIDSRSGTVRWAVNLDWADLALGPLIEERYGLPVALANDSQAAALAEYTFAADPRPTARPNSMIVIRVGRGVGAGIILNGQLYQGDGSGAGEIGHTALVPDGQRCRCGSVGCLETVASLRAMVSAATQVAPHVRDEQQLLAALRAGEPAVAAVVRNAGAMLGLGIAALIGSLNVRRIVLVGPAVALGPPWLEAVRERARRSALPLLAQDTQIELGAERDDVLLGASALLLTNQLGLSLVRR